MNLFEEDEDTFASFCNSTFFFQDALIFSPLQEEILPSPPHHGGGKRRDCQENDSPREENDPEPSIKKSRSSDSELESNTISTAGSSQRRLWVKSRSRDWWDRVNHPNYPETDFQREFKMSRSTFDFVCESLGPAIAKEDTTLRAAIPVPQRVAVCIWRLATGEPLRLVSKSFGLGISTCHKLVLEVCSAIRNVLMPKFLGWPDAASGDVISDRFEAVSGMPNVIGAIYTTHIPIIAPKTNVAAYFNRRHTERNQKTSYSVTVQAVVDPNGVFTDICIGWPGSMTDDKVLENSALYQRGVNGLLDAKCIVGGASFPLMDWILTPYTHQNLTWTQHKFNEKVGEVKEIAKRALSRMKGRWGCLQKRTEMKLQDLPVVLGACCVLHNVCEMRNDGVETEFELVDDEVVVEDGIRSVSSVQVRDHIAHNLLHSGRSQSHKFGIRE